MTINVRINQPARGRRGYHVERVASGRRALAGTTFLSEKSLDESLEDARLNAIADERAAGPFVRVSLDDL
ncbi:MAG: hypothetical protein Q4615_06270 [Paracoccus aminovorans]|nr:hypothetical protein [Paracoccus aminovorans]